MTKDIREQKLKVDYWYKMLIFSVYWNVVALGLCIIGFLLLGNGFTYASLMLTSACLTNTFIANRKCTEHNKRLQKLHQDYMKLWVR